MKTTSSHLTRGVIIAVSLLVLSQAWRAGKRPDTDLASEKIITELRKELYRPATPQPPPVVSSESSIEFVRKLQRPHDPWKDPTDPDEVWHQQRQRAGELMLRYDLPHLDK